MNLGGQQILAKISLPWRYRTALVPLPNAAHWAVAYRYFNRCIAHVMARGWLLPLLASTAASQPPFMPNQWINGHDLPGQPIAVADASDSDGQFCARECNADPACFAFNYAPVNCAAANCSHPTGCCWLKGTVSSADITDVAACASSFIMRPPPTSSSASFTSAPAGAKSVLYILVDDLRPDVAPYGAAWMATPGIQAIASAGVTFDRAYCTIAVCSPSRMSFLTGRYPHNTRTWNFVNHFRQADAAELPHTQFAGNANPYAVVRELGGGAGQCASTCTADAPCVAWSRGPAGNCRLFNSSADVGHTVSASGFISGFKGNLTRRGWVSLPQHFLNNGYLTQGTGKIFHTGEPAAEEAHTYQPRGLTLVCESTSK